MWTLLSITGGGQRPGRARLAAASSLTFSSLVAPESCGDVHGATARRYKNALEAAPRARSFGVARRGACSNSPAIAARAALVQAEIHGARGADSSAFWDSMSRATGVGRTGRSARRARAAPARACSLSHDRPGQRAACGRRSRCWSRGPVKRRAGLFRCGENAARAPVSWAWRSRERDSADRWLAAGS